MRLTIDAVELNDLEKIIAFLSKFKLIQVKIDSPTKNSMPTITRGDKSIDPRPLFGIWEENPRTFVEIRNNAWKRNWDK